MTQAAIILMAKPPVPGKVKTRLTALYSVQQATDIYKQLLLYTADWMNALPAKTLKVLAVADQLQHPFFETTEFSGWQRHLQQGEELGQRMGQVVQHYINPSQPVVLVGGDCPGLNVTLVQQVLTVLQSDTEVVIVPAEDGGYVLIGQKQYYPYLFEKIDWGSDRVLNQTICQLEQHKAQYKLFSPLWDIDRPEDYLRWCEIKNNSKKIT